MLTLDSWLVARLGKDLDAFVRGARIQGMRAHANGFALFCYRRGTHIALTVSVDSNAPMAAAYECAEPQKEIGTDGWLASVAALLRGAAIDAVHAVPNDRVLYVDVSSRSAFGVPSRSRLVIELQPRKANALVLRIAADDAWIVVAAAKQFEGADASRNIKIGGLYEPPPPRHARVDRAQFILMARELEDDHARSARLLSDFDPECTPPLAREVVWRVAASQAGPIPARALLETWPALRREVEDALESSAEVFVARKNGAPSACHLVVLHWALEPLPTKTDSEAATKLAQTVQASAKTVNEVCVEVLQAAPQRPAAATHALKKKLVTLLARCEEEAKGLERSRATAQAADRLREAGDEIYAHLSEIASGADHLAAASGERIALDPLLSAKENAAEYFRKYKKARSGLPRMEARLRTLRANREFWEQLAWELERVDELIPPERETLVEEIADALGIKEQRKRQRRPRAQERTIDLGGGASAHVGRSPKENERLTFSVAGPNDFWFHARGIPGAHVIVKTSGSDITPEQIARAASLAAGSSRAAGAGSVEVDYTQRKHVRRHSSGRPGLVWYTDFSTVRVAPARPEE
jgi:predicted ribosome quality control (RQC) complex YloA/Tae2 family protein